MNLQLLKLIILGVGLGLAVGVGVYTFWYGKGYSYMSNDPNACANCHIMNDQYSGWLKSSHRSVATCNDCHTPHAFIPKYLSKAENGFWHSKGFTLQDFHEPIMIRSHNSAVLQKNCVGCHTALLDELNPHAGDVRRMLDCVHCHREVGHGPMK